MFVDDTNIFSRHLLSHTSWFGKHTFTGSERLALNGIDRDLTGSRSRVQDWSDNIREGHSGYLNRADESMYADT